MNSYEFEFRYYYNMVIFLISVALAGVMLIGGKRCLQWERLLKDTLKGYH